MAINKLPDAKDLELLRRRMSTQFQIPSAYDDALSYQGLIYKLIQYLKDTMQNVEDWNVWLEDFVATFDEKLGDTVREILTEWYNNGTLARLINDIMNERLDNMDIEISSLKSTKVDKTGVGQITWSNIAQDARENISGGSVAVVGLDSVLTNNIVNSAVIPEKTSFIKRSKNLVNLATLTENYFISSVTGTMNENSNYYATDYIYVKGLTNIALSDAFHLAFYDKDKVFISGGVELTLPVPPSAYYIRASIVKNKLYTFQIEAGTVSTAYEPFGYTIPYMKEADVNTDNIINKAVTPEKTSFIKQGKNLVNLDNLTENYYVNSVTGLLNEHPNYYASDYIYIKGISNIALNDALHLAFYDENKAFISGGQALTLAVPRSAYYMRCSILKHKMYSFQIEAGTVSTTYEPFGYTIPFLKGVDLEADNTITAMPNKIYALKDEKSSIYYENLASLKLNGMDINVDGFGTQKAIVWEGADTTSGTKNLTVQYVKNNVVQKSLTTNVVSVQDSPLNTSLLIIGDSTIDGNDVTTPLLAEFASRGGSLTLVGKRGNGHEGRSGWTINRYRLAQAPDGTPNPFYNPTIGDFDFAYYLTSTSQTAPAVVALALGINDVFSYTTDDYAKQAIVNILRDFNYVIANINSVNSTIKTVVSLITPPNSNQDAFGTSYGVGQTQWRYKRNQLLLNQRLVDEFKNKETSRIYLLSNMHNLNPATDIWDGVHPSPEANKKIAFNYYATLRNIL